MNRLVMTFAALLGLLGLRAAERDFTQYVNPLMGTQSSFELSAGNTYPVTALLGDEFLDSPDGEDGRRMAVHVYGEPDPGIQADAPAQSLDQ